MGNTQPPTSQTGFGSSFPSHRSAGSVDYDTPDVPTQYGGYQTPLPSINHLGLGTPFPSHRSARADSDHPSALDQGFQLAPIGAAPPPAYPQHRGHAATQSTAQADYERQQQLAASPERDREPRTRRRPSPKEREISPEEEVRRSRRDQQKDQTVSKRSGKDEERRETNKDVERLL